MTLAPPWASSPSFFISPGSERATPLSAGDGRKRALQAKPDGCAHLAQLRTPPAPLLPGSVLCWETKVTLQPTLPPAPGCLCLCPLTMITRLAEQSRLACS